MDPEEREFGWFAGRAFEVLDWVPQRVTAFASPSSAISRRPVLLALAGRAWLRPRRASSSRAAPAPWACGWATPSCGARRSSNGRRWNRDPAGEDALASLEGMLWRSLVLWFVAYLLVASLSFS